MKKTIAVLLFAAGILAAKAQAPSGQIIKKGKATTIVKIDLIENPIVSSAISALQSGDKETWFSLFSQDVQLFDDGNKIDFKPFFAKVIGNDRFLSIDRVENNSMDIYGKIHSKQWGHFKTYFSFGINQAGKIDRLEIGQANY
ncbi:hypothetical protein [Pedobacter miscanthi]|uniref:hypothetical protein n=1 Tax=Pedobacter miscanthi TaxID=2259170 RepID=UPI00292CBCEC|nr:hypothetical protein [Pedobacter miscanthi]